MRENKAKLYFNFQMLYPLTLLSLKRNLQQSNNLLVTKKFQVLVSHLNKQDVVCVTLMEEIISRWDQVLAVSSPCQFVVSRKLALKTATVICEKKHNCFRAGYRVRQVRQLTYFSFNKHNNMHLQNASNKCPLGSCDNKYGRMDHSICLSLRSSATLIRIHGNSSGHKILSWCFQRKKQGFQSQFTQQY